MILNALMRAYTVARERDWNKIYWAIDLHGVVLKSNYEQGKYEFINSTAKLALQRMSACAENVLILWSSCHDEEQQDIIEFMRSHDIHVHYFNENPEVPNTKTGCFDKKFYFSILLDDKAGFDPVRDWYMIYRWYMEDPLSDLQS